MNKIIKKTMLLAIFIINFFFININKVNATVMQCYYVLPNSSINTSTRKVLNVYDSVFGTAKDSNNFYASFNFNTPGWLGQSMINSLGGKCPKYINPRLIIDIESDNFNEDAAPQYYFNYEEADSSFENGIKNYYGYPLKDDFGISFKTDFNEDSLEDGLRFNSAPTTYIPLYYYKDDDSGKLKKCYLDKNIGQTVSGCTVSYSGIDPVSEYFNSTSSAYNEIFQDKFNNFYSVCNIANAGKHDRDTAFSKIAKVAKKGSSTEEYSNGNACTKAEIDLGMLAAATYYWDQIIENGGPYSAGFKEYNDKLENYRNSVTDDTNFLALGKLKTTGSLNVLHNLVDLKDLRPQLEEISNPNKVCDYASNKPKCRNFYQNCNINSNRKSDEIKSCYRRSTTEEAIKVCESKLKKCMSEDGYSETKVTFENWNTAVSEIGNKVKAAEDSIINAKNTISNLNDLNNPLVAITDIEDPEVTFRCSDVSFLRFIWLILIIAAPIATVIFGILDFTQAIMSGDQSKMNKLKVKFIKRVVALILFILIPILIKTIVNMSDNNSVKSIRLAKCIVNSDE